VREEGVSFRDAYRAVAENPELMSSLSFDKLFGQFRHTGSPGNSGLQVLKQSLQ